MIHSQPVLRRRTFWERLRRDLVTNWRLYVLILPALAALILFREKPSKKQWLGIALGTVAVVLLCDPF